jgi:hypothetical protein
MTRPTTRHAPALAHRDEWTRASAGRFTALVEREEPPPQAERLPIDYVPVLYEDCLVGFSVRGNISYFYFYFIFIQFVGWWGA